MQETRKPKGLKKIWREVKRPFLQAVRFFSRSSRLLYYPLLRVAYRQVAKREKIVLLELDATELIVQKALNNPALNTPGFVKKLFAQPGRPTRSSVPWEKLFATSSSEELKRLQDRLVANTDRLSHEVVARCIATRRFFGEPMPFPPQLSRFIWNDVFSKKILSLILPLDREESGRIVAISKAYCCPYNLPITYPHIDKGLHMHMSTAFGLTQFPLEIQKKVIGKDIIDGGGYSGDSAMIFTEYAPRKCYTFEPNPDTIPVMEGVFAENAAVLGNRKDKIEIVPLALGKSKGTATFQSSGTLDGSARVVSAEDQNVKTYEVGVISIDEFAEEHALDVGLKKLDVEGAEYDTILGAKETIIKQKPLLLISLYHTPKDFFEIKPLIESWDIGYKFEIRHHVPAFPTSEFALQAYL